LASRISQWRGLAELLLTKTNAWRRNVNVNQGFPPGLEQRREMLALLEALSEESDLRSRLTEIRRLPGPRFEERQWQVLESLIEVLPFAAAELQLVFRERGQVDFPEITESARLALGACEQPTELALRLDYRIEHLLVDEFQDTSVSQFELLGQLTLGWQSGDGRTLFLVGDPMQSIYRFRDAEVGLFLRVMQSGWGQIPMETLTLTVNFRSDQSIVAWVNRTFPELFPGRNEPARGAVTYVPFAYHDESPVGRGVAIHPIAAGPEQEAARVVELVRAALDDPGQESIAILVRSRRHLSAILPALKHAGVNYHGVDLVPLSDRPVIIDLMALVRALLMPADRLAWLAILRAPWCGLTLADLYVLAADTGGSVLESLVDANRHALLSSEGRARVERCTVVLKRALAARGRGTFRTWVENAWIALGGPACVDADQLVDAETFFALLSEHEVAADLIDLSQLHRAVGRLWSRPDPSAGERVQVMTLHKAKGLEFDTVIIPGLARVPPMESTKLLIWEEYAQGDESVLLLAPVTEPGQEHDPHYQFLRRLHSQKEEFETLRLLYVGCTRARHALNLLGQVKLDDAGALRAPVQRSLQRRLWPLFEEALADRAARVGSVQLELLRAEREVEHPPQLMRLAQDWRPPPRPEMIPGHADLTLDTPGDAVEFAWAGETARQIGVLVHSVLQWMGEEGLANWDEQRLNEHRVQWHCELTAAGVPEVDVEAALERVMSALSNVMSDPQAAWILKRDHHTPSNELKITTYRDGQLQNLVIDRTFIDASGVRWIIDYKTSSHEGGNTELFLDREVGRYRAQLETYAEALGADDTRPIRLGLYFPLLRGWREWGYP
ncbi:MAG: UvrD-helicase domain-containing protein, partial [Gammaproteobacteria bacterium]|nr:UvrD-helicase domain-containing protein [Gammaproteobacteria bacterium]